MRYDKFERAVYAELEIEQDNVIDEIIYECWLLDDGIAQATNQINHYMKRNKPCIQDAPVLTKEQEREEMEWQKRMHEDQQHQEYMEYVYEMERSECEEDSRWAETPREYIDMIAAEQEE